MQWCGTVFTDVCIQQASRRYMCFLSFARSQTELMKKWAGFGYFLDVAGQPLVDGIKRMETKGLQFTVDTFREVRVLRDPGFKKQLANWMATSINKVSDLGKMITDLAKTQHIEWMWREGNVHINAEKLNDEAMKQKFMAAVTYQDVKVKLMGRWRWKATEPFPPWDKILTGSALETKCTAIRGSACVDGAAIRGPEELPGPSHGAHLGDQDGSRGHRGPVPERCSWWGVRHQDVQVRGCTSRCTSEHAVRQNWSRRCSLPSCQRTATPRSRGA